jgi:hypothetical protein
MISLSDLDAVKASDEAFEFEYPNTDGTPSGVKFKVLGGQSEKVTAEVARLINDRRRKEAARANQTRMNPNKALEFEPMENDVEFGNRLAAVRLVGWSGISDIFSPELALKLCKSNKDIALLITQQSDSMANFTKLKSAN